MPIKTINTKSIDEFWEKICPIGDFLKEFYQPIFRGQADSRWELEPSVFRKQFHEKHSIAKRNCEVDHRYFSELRLLAEYVEQLDKAGLPVPGDTRELRNKLELDSYPEEHLLGKWPCDDLIPLMANAQHHGIPTRLLDFSSNPLVAAHFAATSALEHPKPSKRLSVWIIDRQTLEHSDLKAITTSGSVSKNLSAQAGLFLVLNEFPASTTNLFTVKHNKTISNYLRESKSHTAYKITLETKYIYALLLRCEKYGISSTTLFPGHDGAAKATLQFHKAAKHNSKIKKLDS